jgi:hypothetical protein
MIAIIEAVFGSKVGRVLAEIAFVALLIGAAVLHFEHKGAEGEITRLQKSSNALIDSAKNEIASINERHAAAVKANQEKTDAALAQVTTTNALLADSVRRFDAYRRAHPDVASAPGKPAPAAGGECGTQSCGDLASRLAQAGNELANSQGQLVATLESCQRDRDSLTGLPK